MSRCILSHGKHLYRRRQQVDPMLLLFGLEMQFDEVDGNKRITAVADAIRKCIHTRLRAFIFVFRLRQGE
jgi:hypothetical protein